MGNEIAGAESAKNQKDCCEHQDNGISLLSLVEQTGKSVAGAMHKAENFSAGVIAGAAAGLGLNMSRETAEAVGKSVVQVGVGGAVGAAAELAVTHPRTTLELTGVAAGAVAGALAGMAAQEAARGAGKEVGKVGAAVAAGAAIAAGAAAECAKDGHSVIKDATAVVKDAAIGAALGGAIGAATGDATRAVTLAALGAVTGAAARCAEEIGKSGCCCVKPQSTMDAIKEFGKSTLDHIRNRPFEAGAEAIFAGPVGVMGGAFLHRMLEQKNFEKLCDKAMKNCCDELSKKAKSGR